MWSLGLTEISSYWRRPWRGGGARHLHQSGAAVSPLRKVPTVVQPPGQASLNAWEAGHEVKPPSNGYAGREVIMTSYQELTAGGESSLLFTGCCRAKEVTDRHLDRWTRSELTDEAAGCMFQVGFRAHPTVWLRTLLPRHRGALWMVLVPCPLAQGESSPGHGRCASNNETTEGPVRSGIGVLPQHAKMDFLSGVAACSWWWCQQ